MSTEMAVFKLIATACLFMSVIQGTEFHCQPFWQEILAFIVPNSIILIAIWI